MNTREQVKNVISDFIKEYDRKFGIWAVAIGAGPHEYNEWGKPRHQNRNDYIDWALHVYTDDRTIEEHIGTTYKDVRLMFFFNDK